MQLRSHVTLLKLISTEPVGGKLPSIKNTSQPTPQPTAPAKRKCSATGNDASSSSTPKRLRPSVSSDGGEQKNNPFTAEQATDDGLKKPIVAIVEEVTTPKFAELKDHRANEIAARKTLTKKVDELKSSLDTVMKLQESMLKTQEITAKKLGTALDSLNLREKDILEMKKTRQEENQRLRKEHELEVAGLKEANRKSCEKHDAYVKSTIDRLARLESDRESDSEELKSETCKLVRDTCKEELGAMRADDKLIESGQNKRLESCAKELDSKLEGFRKDIECIKGASEQVVETIRNSTTENSTAIQRDMTQLKGSMKDYTENLHGSAMTYITDISQKLTAAYVKDKDLLSERLHEYEISVNKDMAVNERFEALSGELNEMSHSVTDTQKQVEILKLRTQESKLFQGWVTSEAYVDVCSQVHDVRNNLREHERGVCL